MALLLTTQTAKLLLIRRVQFLRIVALQLNQEGSDALSRIVDDEVRLPVVLELFSIGANHHIMHEQCMVGTGANNPDLDPGLRMDTPLVERALPDCCVLSCAQCML